MGARWDPDASKTKTSVLHISVCRIYVMRLLHLAVTEQLPLSDVFKQSKLITKHCTNHAALHTHAICMIVPTGYLSLGCLCWRWHPQVLTCTLPLSIRQISGFLGEWALGWTPESIGRLKPAPPPPPRARAAGKARPSTPHPPPALRARASMSGPGTRAVAQYARAAVA